MGLQNPACDRGCLDRDGEPSCLVKCCVPLPTYIHYEGCNGCAILGCLCFVPFWLFALCCWTPTLARKRDFLVGGPLIATPTAVQMGSIPLVRAPTTHMVTSLTSAPVYGQQQMQMM